MQKSPKKRRKVYQQIEKPIFHEFSKMKVELHNTYYDADNNEVTVVAETDQVHSLFKTPVRLSNNFNHIWGFKF